MFLISNKNCNVIETRNSTFSSFFSSLFSFFYLYIASELKKWRKKKIKNHCCSFLFRFFFHFNSLNIILLNWVIYVFVCFTFCVLHSRERKKSLYVYLLISLSLNGANTQNITTTKEDKKIHFFLFLSRLCKKKKKKRLKKRNTMNNIWTNDTNYMCVRACVCVSECMFK